MNLIEQLGGYEEAKKHLDSCWCGDDNRAYLLEKLLEYRRQHNIFDLNDNVVFIDDFMHEEIMNISSVNDVDVCMDSDSKRANIDMVRHITDAERQAGKRL